MSHHHSIRNLLNIKDKNITFDENFCAEELIKGVQSKVFYGQLTYQPKACYACGHVFDDQIIKHGFKTSLIKMPSISGFHTYLKLRKQRYFCKHCHSTFTLKTSVVAKNCCISNNTKVAIALNAKDKISEKDIAMKHNVLMPLSVVSLTAFIATINQMFTTFQSICVLTSLNHWNPQLERCPLFSATLKRGDCGYRGGPEITCP